MVPASPGVCSMCRVNRHFCYHFENCERVVVAVCRDCLRAALRFSVELVLPSIA